MLLLSYHVEMADEEAMVFIERKLELLRELEVAVDARLRERYWLGCTR